jgi:putative methionine-R-sulfoxide reductase with GAF domain
MRSSAADVQTTEIKHQDQSRNVVRVLTMIFAASLVVTALEFYLAATLNAWQLLSASWTLVIFTGIILCGWWLARSGRPVLGIWLVFVAMVVIWVISTAFFLANVGFVLGLSLLITIPQMAAQTLPSRHVFRATLWSVIGAFLALVAELFGSSNRLVVPELETFLPVATVLMGLAYGAFIFRQFSRYAIRTKFIVSAVALVTLTVIALTFVISRNTQNTIVNATGQRLNSVSNTHGLLIGELLARQINLLQTLSLNQAIQTNVLVSNNSYTESDAEIQLEIDRLEAVWQSSEFTDPLPQSRLNNLVARELLEFQRRFRSNTNVMATDRYGALIGTTSMVDRYSYSEEPWWQTAYNNGRGATFIGTPEVDQDTELFQLIIAVPVFGNNSQTAVGVLQTVYSLRDLSDILLSAQQEFGETTHLDLFLPPNRIVDIEGVKVETILEPEALAVLEENQHELFSQFEFEGSFNLVSQEDVNTLLQVPDVDSLGWVVITHQPLSDSLAPVREQQRTFIIIGVAVLVAASLGAAFFGQNLSRPIINLTQAAVEVSEGDLAIQARVETDDELGTLARAFNVMTARLRQTISLQEQRISERTRALEVSAEVSRRLSTILDRQTLVNEMVYQVQVAFNYYHAHIYLFDQKGEYLVMVGGTGQAGQKMLEAGHKIPRGKGLVGRAAESRMAVLVQDVASDPDWLPNPLLPETVAEIAVPILAGDDVLGVLDVQHNIRFILREEDAELLQSIANQVAIALQNAEAYRRAQRQVHREIQINEISQKIQNTTTVDMALKTAVREIGQALSADQTVVKLKNGAANGQHSETERERSD